MKEKHHRLFFLGISILIILQFSCKTIQKTASSEHTQQKEKSKKDSIEEIKKTDSPKIKFAKNLNLALKNKEYEKALALFDNLDEKMKTDPQIKILKLSVLISAKKLDNAKKYALELEQKYPNNKDILYSQVMLAQAENNSTKKNAYLNKIIKKNPNDSIALTELGLDAYSKKNYYDARKKFIMAYKSDKKNRKALLGLAKINYMQNKLDQSESNLNEILKYEPNNTIALAELARVKSETDRLFEALKDIKKAIDIDPNIASHWMDLGDYNIRIGRKKEAKEAYTNAINLEPNYYIPYIYRAGLNDDLGFKQEALQDYIKVCKLYPNYYFAWEGAGILFWEKGDFENARIAFVNALKKSPESYQYAILVSLCSYKMKKRLDGKKFMQQYLKTIDRQKKQSEYFMCRLFVDFAGDIEMVNRAYNEKDFIKKGRWLFYVAEFYNLTKKENLASKCYADVLAIQNPGFFEYRLAKQAMKKAQIDE